MMRGLWSFCAIAVCCAATVGTRAQAQQSEPASAIPWLTDSLQSPPELPGKTNTTFGLGIEPISVEPLRETGRDGLGILSPDLTGFPANLWPQMTPEDVAELIERTPYGGVPAVRSLFRQVLLAQTDTPSDGKADDYLLLARIDRLLKIGALSEAQALIELVGPDTSALFRRWFDIGLLTNNADLACTELETSPMLSPARSVQVFCLALGRDWDAAATSLALGEELGQIPPQEADLLGFFLDESLLEEIDPPPVSSPLTSLEFVIRESVGLPRPNTRLPIAFLHAELAEYVPLRFRVEASEQLVREGVLPAAVLFAAYREEKPAASGGVWERLAATQGMDQAATAEEISAALHKLDKEMRRSGLRMAAAEEFLLYLSELPADQFEPDVRDIAALYFLLAQAPEKAELWMSQTAPNPLKTALSVAAGRFDQGTEIEEVLSTTTPEARLSPFQEKLIAQRRTGEAILAAITLLARDDADQDDLLEALALLRATGQEQAAHKVAVQTLLLPLSPGNAN